MDGAADDARPGAPSRSASASTRAMARATGASISLPSSVATPPPLASKAAITRRARSTSPGVGVKAPCTGATLEGWIIALPVKPSARAQRASSATASTSRNSRHGTSRAATPARRAA